METNPVGQSYKIIASLTEAQALALAATSPGAMCFPTDTQRIVFNGRLFGGEDGEVKSLGDLGEAAQPHLAAGLDAATEAGVYTFTTNTGSFGNHKSTSLLLVSRGGADQSGNNLLSQLVITAYVSGSSDANTLEFTLRQGTIGSGVTSWQAWQTVNPLTMASELATVKTTVSTLTKAYVPQGSKETIAEVLALTNAKVGHVWDVKTAFTLNGSKYPAGTNVVCIKATTTNAHGEDCWDALGGIVSDPSYDSQVPDDVATVSALGGIPAGTTAASLKEKTVSEVLDDLIFPTVKPTYVAPTATLAVNSSYGTVREVGGAAPTAANFTTGFNQGSIKIGTTEIGKRAGALVAASSAIVFGSANPTTLPATVTAGAMQYKYRAHHLIGDMPRDSKGNELPDERLAEGDVLSSVVTITGVYSTYYGAAAANATINEVLVKGLAKVLQTVKGSTRTFTLANQVAMYAYPQSFGALTKITDGSGVTDYTADFERSTLTVSGQAYYVYKLKAATTVTGFQFKFA